jgi:nucleoside-diphosphate-sugar epimerase
MVRIFNTYGPRMAPDDGRAVPEFFRAALENRPLPVHGDGSQTRSLCYVDDLIEGILRLALSDTAEPVNIGNPHELTMLELAGLVQEVVGTHPGVEILPRPQDDPTVRRPDITWARTLLGWEPQVGLREGLERTLSWFEKVVRQA